MTKNDEILIIYTSWYTDYISEMTDVALERLESEDCMIRSFKAPGSLEIAALAKAKITTKTKGILAIGNVIRGETSHFKFISQSVFDGIKDLNLRATCPIVLCLLTDDNYQQSIERSGGKHGNKGYDCAAAAAKMSLI